MPNIGPKAQCLRCAVDELTYGASCGLSSRSVTAGVAFEGSGFAQHFAGCLPRVLRELSYMSRALGWRRGGPERLALRDLLGSHARK